MSDASHGSLTCSTCEHWEGQHRYSECALISEAWDGKGLAYVHGEDGEGWWPKLMTQADFGCVSHQPREGK